MAVKNKHLLVKLLSLCILYVRGDEDCPGCMDISCDKFPCLSNELCFMKKVDCFAEPCPALPTCIDEASTVCKDKILDAEGVAVTCESSCGPMQECVGGFCCPSATSVSSVTPDLGVVDVDTDIFGGDGNIPPSFLHPDLYENDDNEEEVSPCTPCELPMCQTVSCPKHKNVHCVQENCSCLFWFVNDKDQMVDCFESDEPMAPILIPQDDSPVTPVATESVKIMQTLKTPTVTLKSQNDSPVTPVATESVKIMQTLKTPTVTLKSQNDEPKDGAWKYILIALCAVAVLCFIAFVAYKLAVKRRKKRQDEEQSKQEEQKVPLNQVLSSSPDNNNDSKPSNHLINGNEDNATSSSTEKV